MLLLPSCDLFLPAIPIYGVFGMWLDSKYMITKFVSTLNVEGISRYTHVTMGLWINQAHFALFGNITYLAYHGKAVRANRSMRNEQRHVLLESWRHSQD